MGLVRHRRSGLEQNVCWRHRCDAQWQRVSDGIIITHPTRSKYCCPFLRLEYTQGSLFAFVLLNAEDSYHRYFAYSLETVLPVSPKCLITQYRAL